MWAIVTDRMRGRLRDPQLDATTAALLEEVAAHRVDPYEAADRLLDVLAGGQP